MLGRKCLGVRIKLLMKNITCGLIVVSLTPPFRSKVETDKIDNDLDDILIDKQDVMLIEAA